MENSVTEPSSAAIIEALLFSTDSALSVNDLSAILDGMDAKEVERCIHSLQQGYETTERSFSIATVAGGFQLVTRPEYARWIKRLYRGRIPSRLTQASLECLAIVAYRQPISRTEIEAVRGVNVDGVMRTLLDRNLIRIAGRGEGVGRPILYATTDEFLRYFGLNRLSDMPKIDELKEMLRERDEALHEEAQESLFPAPHIPHFERDETE
ncbi:MAG: SMC-Scp complex subunit ScpB [candidate division Zixibacteria bacterium]|nr:SMC-Scp complex subunit ScpB [candidate division Zixibacteria bacterium]